MLAVLPLELTVISRIVWRTVQSQHAVFIENLLHGGYVVRGGAVHPEDERGAVRCEIVSEQSRHRAAVVALGNDPGRAIGHAAVRGNEGMPPRPPGSAQLHGIETPYDTWRRHH